MADEAGRTGRSPTEDEAEVTHGRYALGEFAITPRGALDDERPPDLLGGRYEVGRLIGSGGTARVYRAYDVRLGREVAVKIYDRDAVALDQRRRLREMTIQGSISHPGVVALLDSGTEHGRTYLVMQLVEGENLAERLLSGPMPAAEVTALADGLAEALAHVHARRIVHRDLKPANVFLSIDGPLIGDFGIAHALDATHITGTGLIPGTAAYLAPEQVSGEPAGPPADVYALGLILLECLTGRREYPGTMVEAAMARLTRPPRIPEDAPAALAYTLRRMTAREPADRPTAAKVLDMLHAPPPTLPWSRTHRSPRRRRRPAAAAGLPGAAGAASAADSVHDDATAVFSPARGELGVAGVLAAGGETAGDPGPARNEWSAAGALAAAGESAGYPGPARGEWAAAGAGSPRTTRREPGAAGAGREVNSAAPPAHPPAYPQDERPRRRRLAVVVGLAAAAVAVVAAVVLADQGTGTVSPAQPPAGHSPAATSPSTPPAESGTSAPRPEASSPSGPGGSAAQPGTSEAASVEPAADTRETPSATGQPSNKGKPPKTDPPGKTRGKGPGHDS